MEDLEVMHAAIEAIKVRVLDLEVRMGASEHILACAIALAVRTDTDATGLLNSARSAAVEGFMGAAREVLPNQQLPVDLVAALNERVSRVDRIFGMATSLVRQHQEGGHGDA